WDASSGATAYDIFLWLSSQTEPASPTAADLPQSMFDPPGDLEFSQSYSWRVIAKGPSGETPGPVWTFAAQEPPLPEVGFALAASSISEGDGPLLVEVTLSEPAGPSGASVEFAATAGDAQ